LKSLNTFKLYTAAAALFEISFFSEDDVLFSFQKEKNGAILPALRFLLKTDVSNDKMSNDKMLNGKMSNDKMLNDKMSNDKMSIFKLQT
jgi:hypothetical protein